MAMLESIVDAVGGTPLVRLGKVTEGLDAELLAKCEFVNPTGSVKDRIARAMIERAAERGELAPGGLVVENSSGNTGLAVATYCAAKGYRCVITISTKMSREKVDAIRAMGAEVVVCPHDVPADDPRSYYETARRIAAERGGVFLDQYDNQDNPKAHYALLGPEIWEGAEGRVTHFVAGLGTGGTFSGVSKFLKERNPRVRCVAVDPVGSVFYGYFKNHTIGEAEFYEVEGIGEDKLCKAVWWDYMDDVVQVSDADAFRTARELATREGLFVGGSSGAAAFAALGVAREAPGARVVVVLPDSGNRYLSKIYSDEWMRERGFAK